jgi:hypothetical protein
MCVYPGYDDIHTFRFTLARGFEHGIGFSNPVGVSKEDLQFTTPGNIMIHARNYSISSETDGALFR